jgi:hypothetical protein
VKFYGTLDKAWVPAAAAEAHKLGLHVHGHIPHGMRPLEAINAGYDEITHINWIVMQGMPDKVIEESNGIQRFEGPGPLRQGSGSQRRSHQVDHLDHGRQGHLQRSHHGGVRRTLRARERRTVAVVFRVRRRCGVEAEGGGLLRIIDIRELAIW